MFSVKKLISQHSGLQIRQFFVMVVLEQLGFSLNIAVVMHPNGPKCIRYELILSLLGLDTLWVLKNMVCSHYFAVLSLILASGVA